MATGFLSHKIPSFCADDFKDYKIERTGLKSLKVNAIKVHAVGSSANNASSYYSGSVGRWREYELLLTKGGNLVIFKVDFTQWQGERNIYHASVCKSNEDINQVFSGKVDWLLRKVQDYIEEELGISIAETVE